MKFAAVHIVVVKINPNMFKLVMNIGHQEKCIKIYGKIR